jgi:hypothetical protein
MKFWKNLYIAVLLHFVIRASTVYYPQMEALEKDFNILNKHIKVKFWSLRWIY